MDGPILVTGACGFVGANICRYFIERGNRVVGLEGTQGMGWRLPSSPLLSMLQADICEPEGVQRLMDDLRPTYVINCAAYGAYSSQTDVDRIYQVNLDGTRQILEAMRHVGGVRAFVQMGSSSEYGTLCSAPREDGPTWPDSHYAVSKVAASALVRFYALKYQLPAFVMRLYSVYGPFEDASRLIPQLLLKARDAALPPLTNPDISRDFVYVDDVCEALATLYLRAPTLKNGDYYNIGTGVCTTLRDLVDVATKVFDISARPSWGSMPARHWDHGGWYADPSYAREALGWSARTSLADGLSSTMTWLKNNPELVAAAMAQSVLAKA